MAQEAARTARARWEAASGGRGTGRDFIKQKIRSTESLIAELAEGDEAVGWLRSLPGIGEFFSVLIRYEVGEMERFPSSKKFASYTGLVPSTYASGRRITHGRLTKEGNKWLRWAFIEAVSPAIRCSPYLRGYYMRIRARRGTKDARTATARKLAELAWRRCVYAEASQCRVLKGATNMSG
jgi:transposase